MPTFWDRAMIWVLVAAGGGLGSLGRYALGGWVQRATDALFPLGTLVINVLGCLIIGMLGALWPREPYRAFLMIGVLGGFTTFSTFGLETFQFLKARQFVPAALNVLLSVGAGMIAVWFGYRLTERILGVRT